MTCEQTDFRLLDIANLEGTILFGKVSWDCCRLQMLAQARYFKDI